MRVLLTGSTGYIGRRLLPLLVKAGHTVICPVRDQRRFDYEDFNDEFLSYVEVYEVDFLKRETLDKLPQDIDIAYYFIHSLTSGSSDFSALEQTTAKNFIAYLADTTARQTIYLLSKCKLNLLY